MTKYLLWQMAIEPDFRRTKKSVACKMRKMYEAGSTQGDLVRRFGKSEETVRRVLRGVHVSLNGLGLPDISRNVRRELCDADIQAAVELRKSGISFNELGRRFDVDHRTIRKQIEKSNSTLQAAQAAMKAAEETRPPRQRETIFSWAKKWEEQFDERQVV